MNTIIKHAALLALVLSQLTGCASGPAPVKGGTAGQLLTAGKPLAEVQLTLHQWSGGKQEPVGFAVSGGDGSFELVTNEARGPLVLAPGEYSCTLESMGAPVRIPPAYQRADSSPLSVKWSPELGQLHIDVPVQLLP